MAFRMTGHGSAILLSLAFAFGILPVQAQSGLRQTYCSNQNTGSDFRPDSWTWQSNGRCFDNCKSQYAFAVVQDQNCWCSNYIPAQQSDVGQCNSNCPGYPAENCGNKGSGLFGYIALSNRPSGTAGASSPSPSPTRGSASPPAPPSSSPTPSQRSSAGPETVVQTVVQSASVVTSFVTPEPSTPAAASSDTPTSSPPPSSSPPESASPSSAPASSTPTPLTSVYVVTVSGAAITQTVTSIPTAEAEALQRPTPSSTSTGAIAGAVVGGLAGLAAIAGLLIWFLRKRRNGSEADADADAERTGASPRRNTSTLSKTGLLRSAEKEYPQVAIPTNRSSTLANDQDTSSPTSERRSSRPLFYDQRLNPSALMDLDNRSHTSIITMEDNRDYTRTLNIRNPDQ